MEFRNAQNNVKCFPTFHFILTIIIRGSIRIYYITLFLSFFASPYLKDYTAYLITRSVKLLTLNCFCFSSEREETHNAVGYSGCIVEGLLCGVLVELWMGGKVVSEWIEKLSDQLIVEGLLVIKESFLVELRLTERSVGLGRGYQ